MRVGLDGSPLATSSVLGLSGVPRYLCGLSSASLSVRFRPWLIQKGRPLSTRGKLLLWVFVASPDAPIRNSHVLLEAPVLGSTLKALEVHPPL